jgi:uncharacterized protein YhdP
MDPIEAVTLEAQSEVKSSSFWRRFVFFIAIASGAILVTFGVGIVAATYFIAKDPDIVVQLISERTGYFIQVERIEVSIHSKGPKINVWNITAEGDFFATDKKLIIDEAEVELNLWAILGGNTPLIDDLLLRGVRADLTDLFKEEESQKEGWNPSSVFELQSSLDLGGKIDFIGSLLVEDAIFSFTRDSETIEVVFSKAMLSLADRSVNLNATLVVNPDNGSVNFTSHLAQDENGVITANGILIGNGVWIPLPFLDHLSNKKIFNYQSIHTSLTERHGFPGSIIERASIPYEVVFSPNELSIVADEFALTHTNFKASGSAAFNILRGVDEPNFNIDVEFADADASFALAVLPRSLLGASSTKEIERIVAETTVNKAHLYIAYPEIVASEAPSDSLILTAKTKSRSIPIPKWPSVTDASVDLELNRNSLSLAIVNARFAGLPIENAAFKIPSFQHPSRMSLHVPINATLEDIKAMLKRTPLATDVAKFDDCIATGNAKGLFEGDFDLDAKLFKIRSEAAVSDATASCNAVSEKIVGVTANLRLDNSALYISNGHGRVGSDPVFFEVAHLVASKHTTAKVKGVISADLINRLGLNQPEWLSGKTAFELSGKLTGDIYEISLLSTTKGLTIKLPVLPSKDSKEARPLSIEAKGELYGSHNIKASWGDSLYARLTYFSNEPDASRRFGGYVFGEQSNADVQPGVILFGLPNIKGEARYLSAEALWKLDFNDIDLSYIINQGSKSPSSESAANTISQIENSGIDPRSLPSFHFYCKNMRLGQNFGEVEIYTERVKDGLKVSQFDINMGVVSVYNSTGIWRIDGDGKHSSEVAGQLKIRDGGLFLKGLGLASDISGIKGDADFTATWNGAPHQLTPATLSAKANVSVRSIVIEKSRGELLRLVDLVTLNAINVIGGDLNIDRIEARLTYKDGIVTTDDASVELPSAHLAIAGKINPLDKTVDSRVVLTLKVTRIINAIGLAMANPFLGLGYIGYEKTSSRSDSAGYLDRLTRHTYKVIGKWSDPKIAAEGFRFLPGI